MIFTCNLLNYFDPHILYKQSYNPFGIVGLTSYYVRWIMLKRQHKIKGWVQDLYTRRKITICDCSLQLKINYNQHVQLNFH
jgi:hypothetical protein